MTAVDKRLTAVSVLIAWSVAAYLVRVALAIDLAHPEHSTGLVLLALFFFVAGPLGSVWANKARARERSLDRQAMADQVRGALLPAGSSHPTQAVGTD